MLDSRFCAAIEILEQRRMLSVSNDDGTLNIVGTEGRDIVRVYEEDSILNPATTQINIVVLDNGVRTDFDIRDVKAIHIEGGGGSDKLLINPYVALDGLIFDRQFDRLTVP